MDVATLKAKSEGLTKYVQLRDILCTALYDSQVAGGGAETNPMAIPETGDDQSTPTKSSTGVIADDGVAAAGGGGVGAFGSMPSPFGVDMLAPMKLPPVGASEAAMSEVDAVFRPLMAALASLSTTPDAYTERGVEMSLLAARLRPVLGNIGIKCKS